jgi:glycosyltransferase involved in cell wall biosynthesis
MYKKQHVIDHGPRGTHADRLLSVVVPAFNEEQVLPEFHARLSGVLLNMPFESEIVFVNDGSTDGTLTVMQALRAKDSRIAVVNLSRNFGKEIALSAGLEHAQGDAVVVIDADLQDPPEVIPELVRHWSEGYDVVYAQREARAGEGVVKRMTAHAFYRVINLVTKVRIPEDTGDFRILSRRAVDSLCALKEQHRFMKGLFSWIGYPQKAVKYKRAPRHAGKTKWNYWKLWNFALEGITSFSITPLKIASYLGSATALIAFGYALFVIYKTLMYGDPVRGYPSLIVIVLFLGGVQLMAIGIIGEYIGRIFNETKNRPLYILDEYIPSRRSEKPTN